MVRIHKILLVASYRKLHLTTTPHAKTKQFSPRLFQFIPFFPHFQFLLDVHSLILFVLHHLSFLRNQAGSAFSLSVFTFLSCPQLRAWKRGLKWNQYATHVCRNVFVSVCVCAKRGCSPLRILENRISSSVPPQSANLGKHFIYQQHITKWLNNNWKPAVSDQFYLLGYPRIL